MNKSLMTQRINFAKTTLLKIVTHHWSSNKMKGFDVYERLRLAQYFQKNGEVKLNLLI